MSVSTSPPSDWDALERRESGALGVVSPAGSVSVGELRDAVRGCAAALLDRGVRPGDRVVTALPNSLECVVAQLAIRFAGGVVVNLPAQLRREIVEIAAQTEARLVALAPESVDDPVFAVLGDRLFVPDARPRRAESAIEPAARQSDDVAWLAFTSGTTGSAKGAVHTEETLDSMVRSVVERHEIGPADVVVVAAPIGHAIGFVYGVQLAVRAGCAMAIVPHWDAASFGQLVSAAGGTFVAAPTPFLLDVVEAAEAGSQQFATLRTFLCGGAPVPSSLLRRAERALGSGVASAYYGTSEAGAVTTCPPGTPPEKIRSTVGTPLPGMEVRVVDGEIHVRGAHVCSRYWNGDDEGRLHSDGWYATGDLGEIDADGYLVITGRAKELIIRGGVNISPVEVENTLVSADNVRDVAVIGIADRRLGQRIVAVVVPGQHQPTLEDLRSHCEERSLAKVKWPERVVLVERLPRTPSGKLLRSRLTEDVDG